MNPIRLPGACLGLLLMFSAVRIARADDAVPAPDSIEALTQELERTTRHLWQRLEQIDQGSQPGSPRAPLPSGIVPPSGLDRDSQTESECRSELHVLHDQLQIAREVEARLEERVRASEQALASLQSSAIEAPPPTTSPTPLETNEGRSREAKRIAELLLHVAKLERELADREVVVARKPDFLPVRKPASPPALPSPGGENQDLLRDLTRERSIRQTLESEVKRLSIAASSSEQLDLVRRALQSARLDLLLIGERMEREAVRREILTTRIASAMAATGVDHPDPEHWLGALLDLHAARTRETTELRAALEDANTHLAESRALIQREGDSSADERLAAQNAELRSTLRHQQHACRRWQDEARLLHTLQLAPRSLALDAAERPNAPPSLPERPQASLD